MSRSRNRPAPRGSGAAVAPVAGPLLGRRRAAMMLGGGVLGAGALAGGWLAFGRNPEAAAPIDLDANTVTVDKPAIDLGRVPLNVLVPVSVKLTNLSHTPIALGKPVAEALEGC